MRASDIIIVDDQVDADLEIYFQNRLSVGVQQAVYEAAPVQWRSAIERVFATKTEILPLDTMPYTVIPLTHIRTFKRAGEAIRYLRSLDDAALVPDAAVVDIDFDWKEERGFEGVEVRRDDKGRESARLGWYVAAAIKEASRRLGVDIPEIVFYSGKQDVMTDLKEVCQRCKWNGQVVEPFVPVHQKDDDPEKVFDMILTALTSLGRRKVAEVGPNPRAVRVLAELVERGNDGLIKPTLELLADLGDLVALFPEHGERVLGEGDDRLDWAKRLLAECESADFHRELWQAFRSFDGGTKFASPLAAACHMRKFPDQSGVYPTEAMIDAWLRNSSLFCREDDSHAARCEPLAVRVREQGQHWWSEHYEARCTEDDGFPVVGPLTAFGAMFSHKTGTYKSWVAPVRMFRRHVTSINEQIQVSGGNSEDKAVLTDWEYFFHPDHGVFPSLYRERPTEDVRDTTCNVAVTADEVVFSMRFGRTSHIADYPSGSTGGVAGVLKCLRGWGESHCRYTIPPGPGSREGLGVILKCPIWPHGPVVPDGTSREAFFEVIWKIPMYRRV